MDFGQKIVRLTASKTGKTLEVPLHPNLESFLSGLKRRAGNVKDTDAMFPQECARYSKLGSGPFSNEFYDDVLLACGLVTKRSHQKREKEDGETEHQRPPGECGIVPLFEAQFRYNVEDDRGEPSHGKRIGRPQQRRDQRPLHPHGPRHARKSD